MNTAHAVNVWTRSSLCEASSCVEVAFTEDGVMVQSSDGGSALMFSYAEWAPFVAGVKLGEFDGEVVVDDD